MDVYSQYGKEVEKVVISLLKKRGYTTYHQSEDEYAKNIDGMILLDNSMIPIQIKAKSPLLMFGGGFGIEHDQWNRYQEFTKRHPEFKLYIFTTTYNPQLKWDYVIYEKEVSKMIPLNSDSKFIYFKLSMMNPSDIYIDDSVQEKIEILHRKFIRPYLKEVTLNTCKNKFLFFL